MTYLGTTASVSYSFLNTSSWSWLCESCISLLFCACTWEDFSMKIIYLGLLHIAIENFTSYFHLLGFILRSIRQFGKLFPIPHWIWLQQIIGLFHKCKFFVWHLANWNVKLSWKWGDLYKVSDNENCKWEFLTWFLGWLGDILSILKFKVVEQ